MKRRVITFKCRHIEWELDLQPDDSVIVYVHPVRSIDYLGREESCRGRWDPVRRTVTLDVADPELTQAATDALRRE